MEIYHPRDDELLREMRRVRREKGRKLALWGLLVILVLSAVFGWLVLNRWYMLSVVHGPSMGDALPEGSLVLVRRTAGAECGPGDIILYETERGYQMKRVIAEGGDHIVLNPYGDTRINGAVSENRFSVGRNSDADFTARRLTVPDGELFVQGDLLSLSTDSRNKDYGTVPAEKVIGKAAFVLWPVCRIGEPVTEMPPETAETEEAGAGDPADSAGENLQQGAGE